MRFVWAFAIACLVAATSVAPEIETQERSHAAQLERAREAIVPQMLATRGHDFRPNAVRLSAFTVPTALALDIPPRAIVAAATAPHAPPFSVTEVPRSARGPPIA